MFAQLAARLAGLKLPLRLQIGEAPPVDLGPSPRVTLIVRDPGLFDELAEPTLDRLGEAFIDERLEVQGAILDVIAVADRISQAMVGSGSAPPPARSAHDKALDAEAIAYHYDLSNDFYRLWLDQEMIYSCAYFHEPNDSLERAQEQKLELLCRKLRLRPGERLLDVGCGWGGLARYAARHHGALVTGITLSRAQLELGRQRVAQEGLEDRVRLELCDYRDLAGSSTFDKVVSVGMFEHVGLANLKTYFGVLYQQVRPGGLVLNHGITSRHVDGRPVGRGAGAFIGRYVFPHGELPHLSTAVAEMSEQGLEVVDVEGLRLHYARTLEHWSARLEASLGAAESLVPRRALRIWRIYLAGCAYGFRKGWVNIHQILAVRPEADGSHSLPLTRADLYR